LVLGPGEVQNVKITAIERSSSKMSESEIKRRLAGRAKEYMMFLDD